MVKKEASTEKNISLTRLSRTLFFFIGLFMISIVVFDSGNLITGEAVNDRWLYASGLLLAVVLSWLVGALKTQIYNVKTIVTCLLAVCFVAFAGYMTYAERGMASTSTIFYVLPLLIIATLKNRRLLLATATLTAGTLALSSVKYFNDFFNEGYRIQLWATVFLYAGTIFVVTWLIMVLTNLRHDSE